VQDLQNDLAALGMHRLRDRSERIGLLRRDQQGPRFVQQAILAGGIAARDDQARATACALGIEQGQPVDRPVQRLQAGVHRSHQRPVAKGVRADLQRGEQRRKENGGFGGHGERPFNSLTNTCSMIYHTASTNHAIGEHLKFFFPMDGAMQAAISTTVN
jgi:hypothetical protein